MANSAFENKSTVKNLQGVSDAVKDSAQHLASDLNNRASDFSSRASELGSRAKDMASHSAESAKQMYSETSDWVQENSGKTAGMVCAIAAAGVIGFFIGKNTSRS